MTKQQALAMEGSGWDGDLDEIRGKVIIEEWDSTTLVDTSAWVEFLRSTGSDVNVRVRSMIDVDERLATTDVVIMGLLCGAGRSDPQEPGSGVS